MSGNCTSNVYTLSGHVTLATGVDDLKSQYYSAHISLVLLFTN